MFCVVCALVKITNNSRLQKQAPKPLLWLASWVDKSVALVYPMLNRATIYDNTPSKEILGIQYHDLESTFAAYGHSLIYHGMVKKSSSYQPPRPDWTPMTAD